MDLDAKCATTTTTTSSNDALPSATSSTSVFVVSPAGTSAAAASRSSNPRKRPLSTTTATTQTHTILAKQRYCPNDSQHSINNSTDICSCDQQTNAVYSNNDTAKRKRRLTSDSNDAKDPEIGLEPPSAKRQQRLPALYAGSDQSNVSSVASSVYTSPVPETHSAHELLSIRSSPAEDLSEAPHSPLPDSPDSPPSPDRGTKNKQTVEMPFLEFAVDELEYDECEEINSFSTTPTSTDSSSSLCSQNGERTPGQPSAALASSCRSINNNNLPKVKLIDDYMAKNFKCMSPAVENPIRQCPLPALSWANAPDVWQRMCHSDEQDARLRSSTMLERHPGLQPRMRAILLDWLNEVCEVYKLHRETFYLAVDYLDRYLHKVRGVQKTHLQLIGITCLFVAAKVEEIYPPKIGEFAYVTDGACTEKDILQNEKLLLGALNWEISPITVIAWLGVYMQLNANNRTPASFGQQADDAFIYPQFSGYEFVQTSQLLDLCTLDVGMANFSYSVLAAAAISHTFNREIALRCSGLDWQVVQPCARWLEPFFRVISKKAAFLQVNEQNEQVTNKFGLANVCPNIVTDDSHIIQTHTTTMDMYDELLMAQEALHAMRSRVQASPATGLRAPESLLTPPASGHKPDDYLADEEDAAVGSSSSSSSSSNSTRAVSTSNINVSSSHNIANRENIALTGNDNNNCKK